MLCVILEHLEHISLSYVLFQNLLVFKHGWL